LNCLAASWLVSWRLAGQLAGRLVGKWAVGRANQTLQNSYNQFLSKSTPYSGKLENGKFVSGKFVGGNIASGNLAIAKVVNGSDR